MSESQHQQTINGNVVNVHDSLRGFNIKKQPSSHVDYFGTNHVENQLFMQFNNGACTIFSNVPKEVLDLANDAASIGKFYHQFLKGKYEFKDIGTLAINLVDQGDEDEDFETPGGAYNGKDDKFEHDY